MRNSRMLLLIGCLVFSGAYLAPKANAGEWDQKTILTFDRPVELPGVVLPAGIYVFKLVDSLVDRNIVQVLSRDERTLYATIKTIPDYRATTTEDTSLVFEEKDNGEVRSLKEWFYPDRRYGHEFVYSKQEPVRLAKTDESRNPPESITGDIPAEQPTESSESGSYMQALHQKQNESRSFASDNASGSAANPTDTGNLDSMQAQQQSQPEEPGSGQASAQPATPKVLPKTASLLPLVFLSGISLVAASFGLRLYSKRIG